MSNEELMKPRYKVIADYPDAIKSLGEIFTTYENGVDYVTEISKCDVRNFPHLFKKLGWWEERYLNELPLFIKNKTARPVSYTKIDSWKFSNRDDLGECIASMVVDGKEKDINFWAIEPATEQEYLSNLALLEDLNK